MNVNYRKKKQPQIVRTNLLEAAAQIVVERGLSGVTLDLVAQKAGISKGGLIHHFSSKKALTLALYTQALTEFEKALDSYMRKDPEPRGRFLRAYVNATITPPKSTIDPKLFGGLVLAMSRDGFLSSSWKKWLRAQMKKHGENIHSPLGNMIRYAADGIWLEECTGARVSPSKQRKKVVEHLLKLTYES